MPRLAVLGIDLAKSVFQLHGVGADGDVAVQRKLHRPELMTWLAGRRFGRPAPGARASALPSTH